MSGQPVNIVGPEGQLTGASTTIRKVSWDLA